MFAFDRRNVVIIAVSLFFAAVVLLARHVEIPIAALSRPSEVRTIAQNFDLTGIATLEVSSTFADLTAFGAAQPRAQARLDSGAPSAPADETRIEIKGTVRGYTHDAVDAVRVTLERQGDHATVRIAPPDDFGWRHLTGAFTLRVPERLALVIHTSNGDVTVTGHEGALDVSTSNGNATLREIGGSPLRVRSGNGDIAIAFADGWNTSHVDVQDGNGDIVLELPRAVAPSLYVSTGNGDVHDDAHLTRVDRSTADIVLRNGNGDITLRRTR